MGIIEAQRAYDAQEPDDDMPDGYWEEMEELLADETFIAEKLAKVPTSVLADITDALWVSKPDHVALGAVIAQYLIDEAKNELGK